MRYRTIFLSDVHLGTRGCQAEMLLDFLSRAEAETWYLVGDILDGWRLRRGWHWPRSHNEVVQAILAKANAGARIVFIPGNHDEFARAYPGIHFGGIEVTPRAVHETADGRRLLVTHGDQFDAVVMNAKWLAHVGDVAYEVALWLNTRLNRVLRVTGRPYWSLSNWCKARVKHAVNYIGEYEAVLADEARRHGCHGIVCGHIHAAALREIDGVTYVNTGDWVESCTAVAEEADGTLRLIDWGAQQRRRAAIRAIPKPESAGDGAQGAAA